MSFIEVYNFLNLLSPGILILGIILGILTYRNLDIIHRGITIYLIIMLTVDMTGRIFEYLYGNNLFILLIYSLIEVIVFTYFYFKFIFKRKHYLALIFSIIGIVYICSEIVKFENNIIDFQPYSKVVDNAVIIYLSLTFLYEKVIEFKQFKFQELYLQLAILIFFTINSIIFLPLNFILNQTVGKYFWQIILFITVIFYSYLTYSISQNARQNKLQSISDRK